MIRCLFKWLVFNSFCDFFFFFCPLRRINRSFFELFHIGHYFFQKLSVKNRVAALPLEAHVDELGQARLLFIGFDLFDGASHFSLDGGRLGLAFFTILVGRQLFHGVFNDEPTFEGVRIDFEHTGSVLAL